MMIGKVIKDWRHVNRIGVRAVAEQIGISASTLSRIENGEDFDGSTMSKLFNWLFVNKSPQEESHNGND